MDTASEDDTARLWDARSGEPLGGPMQHDGDVKAASLSPDGTKILTVNSDVRVWDARDGNTFGEPIRHTGGATTAKFSPDGRLIVTAGFDNTAQIWDARTRQPIGEPMPHPDSIEMVNFSPDGNNIVTAGKDGVTRLWWYSALDLPPAVPDLLIEWGSAIAGWRFDSNGRMQPVPAAERLRSLEAPRAGNDAWARLTRWLATEPRKRTTHPDSPNTNRQIAERERDVGTQMSLDSALRYDASLPLVRLLLAAFEENADRARFLRDYDLQRLPDDPQLWSHAVRALAKQKDSERARGALEKLASIAPEQAQTLKIELSL